jgi:hypothetical protein
MNDIFEDIFDEAGALGNVDTETGKNLSDLVRKLRAVEKEIDDAEEHLKVIEAKRSTRSLCRKHSRPSWMRWAWSALMWTASLWCASSLIHASIPARIARTRLSLGCARTRLDDIIKNDVTVSFGKGQDNIAGDLVGKLEQDGFNTSQKTYVHPSTLKAFVKERFVERQANRPRHVRGLRCKRSRN